MMECLPIVGASPLLFVSESRVWVNLSFVYRVYSGPERLRRVNRVERSWQGWS